MLDTRLFMPRACLLAVSVLMLTGMNRHEKGYSNFAVGYGTAFRECSLTEGL